MWFAAIGGIENMYKRIFGIMVWRMTYHTFINAVLGALFLMKKNRDKKDNIDPDDPNSKDWIGYEAAGKNEKKKQTKKIVSEKER